MKSSSMSGEIYTLEHNDGSQSDTAVGTVGAGGKKRRSSLSAKVVAIVSRRSRSTSQLSQTVVLRVPHVICEDLVKLKP
ncbi:Regulating synaptic membrane exocytosis protein 1 [Fukomys damarensis]|uniref:Regulating synaptic membrane exocytosis protein 1 n=1 Tax=Fukomys damarensis TaxID=885580 RepID=A0A091DYD9_FUKDA|nr:Regulating synaptic membrane exocytosis protein 1 [Fukomys damarensis]